MHNSSLIARRLSQLIKRGRRARPGARWPFCAQKLAVWAQQLVGQQWCPQQHLLLLSPSSYPSVEDCYPWRPPLPGSAFSSVACAVLLRSPRSFLAHTAALVAGHPQHRPRQSIVPKKTPCQPSPTLNTMSDSSICGALFANLCVTGIGQWCNVCQSLPCLASHRQLGLIIFILSPLCRPDGRQQRRRPAVGMLLARMRRVRR